MKTKERKYSEKNLIPTEYPSFSESLRYVMVLRDCSCHELANRLFLAYSTVSGYLCGRRFPDCNMIRRIAIELNVSADFLLGLSDRID